MFLPCHVDAPVTRPIRGTISGESTASRVKRLPDGRAEGVWSRWCYRLATEELRGSGAIFTTHAIWLPVISGQLN